MKEIWLKENEIGIGIPCVILFPWDDREYLHGQIQLF